MPKLSLPDILATLASGLLFGFGLAWSTMIRPESVLNFLVFDDLGLLLVLCSAVGINLLVYQLAPRIFSKTLLKTSFQQRPFDLDRSALLGAVIFGIGVTVCRITIAPWSIQSPFTVHGPTSRPSAQDTNRRKSD